MPKTKINAKVRPERDAEFLVVAPEVSIFLACMAAVDELRALATTYESGELTRVAFSRRSTRVVAELSELANATERFDIVCPVLEFGLFSPFFWRWFNWWSDYLQDLSPRQLTRVEKLSQEPEYSSKQPRPPAHWLKYRSTPAFALVIN
ncbi:MAG TPA: hypothetical protein VL793_05710 [Patescibacteria group bacterium]|jgi:hypothetical protein|nr:hypothetical protein [Patescibacteria group bacterium]